jgi:L-lactate dehydrogenase complex protein LldF
MSLAVPNVTFHERVEDALHNPQLHTALDRATGRFKSLRLNALASLPLADEVRDRARLIRAHTLARLDEYLTQFAEAAERRGTHIHWADDAAEANAIVKAIAKAGGVKLVVKGKSMVSEEIHLNHALEETGVKVIESDLGEYIIQLAGETPSHIIVPVIHKTKEQIGQLLHEKIGMPLTDVPEEMTAAARVKLREAFLTAGMGITGVNFGVASTGSIALLENEGNGRLTTTPPRIHVALMGIERLVPTLEDLGVMLQVLARSATGQKITVYNNILTGPRRAGEADGPEELHIVLVDNGRSRVLASEAAEILYCIRCGACLNACPVYQQIGGHAYGSVYPGPVGAVLTPALGGIGPWNDLPHASSLCGACREVCPVRIDIPRMLLELRDEGHRSGKSPLWLRAGLPVYGFAAVHPALFRLAVKVSSLLTRALAAGSKGWLTRLPPPLNGWTDYRDFPAFASQSFSQQLKQRRKSLH